MHNVWIGVSGIEQKNGAEIEYSADENVKMDM